MTTVIYIYMVVGMVAQRRYSASRPGVTKRRLVELDPDADAALGTLAKASGASVNALLNDAVVMYVEKMTFVGSCSSTLVDHDEPIAATTYAANASPGVNASLDQYHQRLSHVRDAYSDAVDRLAGPKDSSP